METLNTGGGGGGASAAASPSLQISSSASLAMASSAAGANASPAFSSSEISSHNAALARDASSLFHSARYRDCLNVLHQLLLTDHDNPKVIHNIAVVEYFQGGCTDPQKILDVMSNIKRRIEEISKTAGEHLDGASALLTSSPSSANSSSSKGSAASNADTPTSYLEDYDTSTANFNIAVILFHLQEFTAALSVLEPLYQNIEPIDESAALHICLLMLDITLATHQLRKACDVLQYMERAFGPGFLVTSSDNGSNVPPNPMVLPTTTESVPDLGNIAVALNSPRNSMVGEVSLTRSSSEEVLDDDVLSLGFDVEGSNSTKPVTSLSMLARTIGMPPVRPPAAPQDPNVKIILHLNKVRLYLSTQNTRAAKREIKLAMNLTQGGDMLTELMLKAHLEYSRGNHRKAVKLLMACSGREPGLKCVIWNNLGCIHHYMMKDSTSYHYFRKALQCSTSPNGEKPLKFSKFSHNRPLSILYNCGLQQLRGGNPILAARCFQEAGSLYHRHVLLWLRLAECCISALEKGLLEKADGYDNSIKRDELRVFSVGMGKWRKLFLPTGGLNPSLSNGCPDLKLEDKNGLATFTSSFPTNGADFFVPGKSQKLNLVFARQCLRTAKHLLSRSMVRAGKDTAEVGVPENDEDISGDVKYSSFQNVEGNTLAALQPSSNGITKEGKISSTNTLLTSVIAFEEDQQKQNAAVLQYILADLSFVELCLDNPVGALKISRELLQQPDCSKPFKFLGRVYAAEALCLLNRPIEAAIELSTCMTESNNIETLVNGSDEDGQKWRSGENSEASGEGDEGNNLTAGNVSSLTEALSISSLTGARARASLFVNLAMVHVMRGDLSQANHSAMQAVSITPASPSAVLSVVYVNLLQGRTQEAVALLKHCRHLCVVSPR